MIKKYLLTIGDSAIRVGFFWLVFKIVSGLLHWFLGNLPHHSQDLILWILLSIILGVVVELTRPYVKCPNCGKKGAFTND